MNIILLLNNDIASNLALNLLLPELTTHKVTVFLSSKVGGNAERPEALQDLALFEQQGVYCALDKKESADQSLVKFKTYAELAQKYGIKVALLNDINSPEGIARIKAFAPDVMVSIRYGVILKGAVINIAKHGVINLHSGLLPDYRGVMATFWALLNGDKQLSTSLHFIDDSTIDTGRIIANSTLTVQQGKSYLWHVLSLYVGSCELIFQALNTIEKHGILSTQVQPSGGHYYSFPNEETLASFISAFGALYRPDEITTLLASAMATIPCKQARLTKE